MSEEKEGRQNICKNCEFWRQWLNRKSTVGECRRNPPVMVSEIRYSGPTFPTVSDKDWCGEWKERPPEGVPF